MSERQLNPNEERELVERLSEIARSGLPLPEGLKAAGAEATSKRLKRQLNHLASKCEAGANWEDVLNTDQVQVRPHVLGIVRAGIRTGELGNALDGLVDQDRVVRDLRRELFTVFAYPLILIVAVLMLFLFATLFVVPQFEDIYSDFGMELPWTTNIMLSLSRTMPQILIYGGVLLLGLLVAVRVFGGRSGWMQFVSAIPIVGTMIHYAGVSQMLRLLEIILQQKTPLPDALSLTSSGVSDANVQRTAAWLADGVSAGNSLSQLIGSTPLLPNCIGPVIEWGENHNQLPSALRDSYGLLEGHIRLHKSIITLVVGPLLMLFVALTIGFMVIGLMMPLVSLIQNLT